MFLALFVPGEYQKSTLGGPFKVYQEPANQLFVVCWCCPNAAVVRWLHVGSGKCGRPAARACDTSEKASNDMQ